MTRLPGAPAGVTRKAMPDVYSVLLVVGILFLLVATIVCCADLFKTYGLGFGDLFTGAEIPKPL